DGKTYELVPAGNYTVGEVDDQGHLKSTDPTTGKVIEGDKNVTYVYKLKETPAEPKGNVYVHYVDTEGKTIKSDVTDEEAQPVDKDYDTVVDNRPQEIEKDGKTYELVPAGNYTVGEVDDEGHLKSTDPTTGKVIEGDKNVTYVYKLKETPDKPVEPTPDKPVNPTPGKPVNPTPGKPVNPTPGKPVNPTPGKPVNPTPGKPVNPTPGKPVDPTPGKPVNPTPDKPVSEQPANPTSAKEQLPNTGETTSAGSTVLGVVAGLVGLAALGRRKKEDEK
ncbi:LPXTG cell wall anchor domain-containing protein, partial [Streptococcus infantis]|uniref:LPXTG cell wall anchor domain-containing protein n=1 Tax=Streptococcus infantis TaxID=68892 RepID=UPI0039C36A62